ncbi:hypothetical protein AAGS61_18170 [Lysinibacillus sp. KU-BSD001]|uniref:hypothetical protein n=1 Tax=Lysinibacillus sp. KU-BSD001 TaxID=3141328 RepID=UPI0036E664FD
MRTSRVSMAASSTYRNAKRYLETEEAFILFNDGSSLEHFNERQQKKQKKQKKTPAAKPVLVNKKQHVLIKGIQFDADTVTIVRNHLLHQSLNVSYLNNMKRRHHTYRTSI